MYPPLACCWMRSLALLAAANLCGLLDLPSHAQEAKPVVVARVTQSEVRSGQRVVGTVNPARTTIVGSAVDGRVEEFLVNQGDAVTEGQPLAKLRTQTLEIELSAANAEVELAVHRLAELENGSRSEDIAEAEANMRGANAALRNAESQLRRKQTLVTRGAASTTDLEDAQERADAAKFAFDATDALLNRMKEGPRQETLAQARAQVDLQTQRLNLIADRITKFTIVAPFDGYVSAEFTEVGAWISQGDPIVEVIQMDEVEIEAPVTAEAAVSLRRGDTIRIEFPEIPNELWTGTIERIVPIAVARSRTFPVHIRIKNKVKDGTPMLMAGMLARVDLPSGQRRTLPLVPKDALVLNGDDRAVFVVEDVREQLGTVSRVSVDLGVAVGGRIQVEGKITVDDLVVVVGNERLIPNSTVRIIREQP